MPPSDHPLKQLLDLGLNWVGVDPDLASVDRWIETANHLLDPNLFQTKSSPEDVARLKELQAVLTQNKLDALDENGFISDLRHQEAGKNFWRNFVQKRDEFIQRDFSIPPFQQEDPLYRLIGHKDSYLQSLLIWYEKNGLPLLSYEKQLEVLTSTSDWSKARLSKEEAQKVIFYWMNKYPTVQSRSGLYALVQAREFSQGRKYLHQEVQKKDFKKASEFYQQAMSFLRRQESPECTWGIPGCAGMTSQERTLSLEVAEFEWKNFKSIQGESARPPQKIVALVDSVLKTEDEDLEKIHALKLKGEFALASGDPEKAQLYFKESLELANRFFDFEQEIYEKTKLKNDPEESRYGLTDLGAVATEIRELANRVDHELLKGESFLRIYQFKKDLLEFKKYHAVLQQQERSHEANFSQTERLTKHFASLEKITEGVESELKGIREKLKDVILAEAGISRVHAGDPRLLGDDNGEIRQARLLVLINKDLAQIENNPAAYQAYSSSLISWGELLVSSKEGSEKINPPLKTQYLELMQDWAVLRSEAEKHPENFNFEKTPTSLSIRERVEGLQSTLVAHRDALLKPVLEKLDSKNRKKLEKVLKECDEKLSHLTDEWIARGEKISESEIAQRIKELAQEVLSRLPLGQLIEFNPLIKFLVEGELKILKSIGILKEEKRAANVKPFLNQIDGEIEFIGYSYSSHLSNEEKIRFSGLLHRIVEGKDFEAATRYFSVAGLDQYFSQSREADILFVRTIQIDQSKTKKESNEEKEKRIGLEHSYLLSALAHYEELGDQSKIEQLNRWIVKEFLPQLDQRDANDFIRSMNELNLSKEFKELKLIVGAYVEASRSNEEGLNFATLPKEIQDEDRFIKFLQDQASQQDDVSMADPYEKALQNPEVVRALKKLFKAYRGGEILSYSRAEKEEFRQTLVRLKTHLVNPYEGQDSVVWTWLTGPELESFVNHHSSKKSGRAMLKGILEDQKNYSLKTRLGVAQKTIAKLGDEGWVHENRARSAEKVFATETETISSAQFLLELSELRHEEIDKNGEKNKYTEILEETKKKWGAENRIHQRLAAFADLLERDSNWIGTEHQEFNGVQVGTIRRTLLNELDSLLHEASELEKNGEGKPIAEREKLLLAFSEKVKHFAEDGYDIKHFIQILPIRLREPFNNLTRSVRELEYAHNVGHEVIIEATRFPVKNPKLEKLEKQVQSLEEGLLNLELSLIHQYKEGGWLERLWAQARRVTGGGDYEKLQKAIASIKSIRTQLAQKIEKEISGFKGDEKELQRRIEDLVEEALTQLFKESEKGGSIFEVREVVGETVWKTIVDLVKTTVEMMAIGVGAGLLVRGFRILTTLRKAQVAAEAIEAGAAVAEVAAAASTTARELEGLGAIADVFGNAAGGVRLHWSIELSSAMAAGNIEAVQFTLREIEEKAKAHIQHHLAEAVENGTLGGIHSAIASPLAQQVSGGHSEDEWEVSDRLIAFLATGSSMFFSKFIPEGKEGIRWGLKHQIRSVQVSWEREGASGLAKQVGVGFVHGSVDLAQSSGIELFEEEFDDFGSAVMNGERYDDGRFKKVAKSTVTGAAAMHKGQKFMVAAYHAVSGSGDTNVFRQVAEEAGLDELPRKEVSDLLKRMADYAVAKGIEEGKSLAEIDEDYISEVLKSVVTQVDRFIESTHIQGSGVETLRLSLVQNALSSGLTVQEIQVKEGDAIRERERIAREVVAPLLDVGASLGTPEIERARQAAPLQQPHVQNTIAWLTGVLFSNLLSSSESSQLTLTRWRVIAEAIAPLLRTTLDSHLGKEEKISPERIHSILTLFREYLDSGKSVDQLKEIDRGVSHLESLANEILSPLSLRPEEIAQAKFDLMNWLVRVRHTPEKLRQEQLKKLDAYWKSKNGDPNLLSPLKLMLTRFLDDHIPSESLDSLSSFTQKVSDLRHQWKRERLLEAAKKQVVEAQKDPSIISPVPLTTPVEARPSQVENKSEEGSHKIEVTDLSADREGSDINSGDSQSFTHTEQNNSDKSDASNSSDAVHQAPLFSLQGIWGSLSSHSKTDTPVASLFQGAKEAFFGNQSGFNSALLPALLVIACFSVAAAITLSIGYFLLQMRRIDSLLSKTAETSTSSHPLGKPASPDEMLQLRIEGGRVLPGFSQAMYQAAESGARDIRERRASSLEDLLSSIAQARHRFAVESHEPRSEDFGKRDKEKREIRLAADPTSPWLAAYAQEGLRGKKEGLDPENQNLVEWSRSVFNNLGEKILIAFYFFLRHQVEIFLSEENKLEALNQAARIYKELLEGSFSQAQIIEKVAELHWWLVYAIPYKNGSASIADATTKAILLAHGIIPGRWKEGVAPDIKAFFLSKEEFIKQYPSFFEGNPDFVKEEDGFTGAEKALMTAYGFSSVAVTGLAVNGIMTGVLAVGIIVSPVVIFAVGGFILLRNQAKKTSPSIEDFCRRSLDQLESEDSVLKDSPELETAYRRVIQQLEVGEISSFDAQVELNEILKLDYIRRIEEVYGIKANRLTLQEYLKGFEERLKPAPRWVKEFAEKHPDLPVYTLAFSERPDEDGFLNPNLMSQGMGEYLQELDLYEPNWYASGIFSPITFLPELLSLSAPRLRYGDQAMSFRLTNELTPRQEAIRWVGEDLRPALTSPVPNSVHSPDPMHPAHNSPHEHTHRNRMSGHASFYRRDAVSIAESFSHPEMSDKRIQEIQEIIIEQRFRSQNNDEYYQDLFTYLRQETLYMSKEWVIDYLGRLSQVIEVDHPRRLQILNAYRKVFAKELGLDPSQVKISTASRSFLQSAKEFLFGNQSGMNSTLLVAGIVLASATSSPLLGLGLAVAGLALGALITRPKDDNLLGKPASPDEMFQLRIPGWPAINGFSRFAYESAERLAQGLKEKTISSFSQLLSQAADFRYDFAISNREGDEFGIRRTNSEWGETDIAISDIGFLPWLSSFEEEAKESIPIHYRRRSENNFERFVEIGGEKIKLNEALVDEGLVVIGLPPASVVDQVLEEVERLFLKARDRSLSKPELLQLVAEIHFYLAASMPYHRGSAAIADIVAKSILFSHGMKPGRWKPGISPDLKAFFLSKEEFIKQYPSFFEGGESFVEEKEKFTGTNITSDPVVKEAVSQESVSASPLLKLLGLFNNPIEARVFYEKELERLDQPGCALKDSEDGKHRPYTDYKNILTLALAGEIQDPLEVFFQLSEVLKGDYTEGCRKDSEFVGHEAIPLEHFLNDRYSGVFSESVERCLKEEKCDGLVVDRIQHRSHPFSLSPHSRFYFFGRQLYLSFLDSLALPWQEDDSGRKSSPGFFLYHLRFLLGVLLRKYSLEDLVQIQLVSEIKKDPKLIGSLFLENKRPFVLSSHFQYAHGRKLHPYEALLHDFYHLCLILQLLQKGRKEIAQVYLALLSAPEALQEYCFQSDDMMSVLLEEGDYQSFFRRLSYASDLQDEIKSFYRLIQESSPNHPALGVMRDIFKDKGFSKDETGSIGAEKSLLLSFGLGSIAAGAFVGGPIGAAVATAAEVGALAIYYRREIVEGLKSLAHQIEQRIQTFLLGVRRFFNEWNLSNLKFSEGFGVGGPLMLGPLLRLLTPEDRIANYCKEVRAQLDDERSVLKGNPELQTLYLDTVEELQRGEIDEAEGQSELNEIILTDYFDRIEKKYGVQIESCPLPEHLENRKKRGLKNPDWVVKFAEKYPRLMVRLLPLTSIKSKDEFLDPARMLQESEQCSELMGLDETTHFKALPSSIVFWPEELLLIAPEAMYGDRAYSFQTTSDYSPEEEVFGMALEKKRPRRTSPLPATAHSEVPFHPAHDYFHEFYHRMLSSRYSLEHNADAVYIASLIQNKKIPLSQLRAVRGAIVEHTYLLREEIFYVDLFNQFKKMVFEYYTLEDLWRFYRALQERFPEDHPRSKEIFRSFRTVFEVFSPEEETFLIEEWGSVGAEKSLLLSGGLGLIAVGAFVGGPLGAAVAAAAEVGALAIYYRREIVEGLKSLSHQIEQRIQALLLGVQRFFSEWNLSNLKFSEGFGVGGPFMLNPLLSLLESNNYSEKDVNELLREGNDLLSEWLEYWNRREFGFKLSDWRQALTASAFTSDFTGRITDPATPYEKKASRVANAFVQLGEFLQKVDAELKLKGAKSSLVQNFAKQLHPRLQLIEEWKLYHLGRVDILNDMFEIARGYESEILTAEIRKSNLERMKEKNESLREKAVKNRQDDSVKLDWENSLKEISYEEELEKKEKSKTSSVSKVVYEIPTEEDGRSFKNLQDIYQGVYGVVIQVSDSEAIDSIGVDLHIKFVNREDYKLEKAENRYEVIHLESGRRFYVLIQVEEKEGDLPSHLTKELERRVQRFRGSGPLSIPTSSKARATEQKVEPTFSLREIFPGSRGFALQDTLLIAGAAGFLGVVGLGVTGAVKAGAFVAAGVIGGVAVAALAIGTGAYLLFSRNSSISQLAKTNLNESDLAAPVSQISTDSKLGERFGLLPPDSNFFAENQKQLGSEDSPLAATSQLSYQEILTEVLAGKISPVEAILQLIRVIDKDFIQKCLATGYFRERRIPIRQYVEEQRAKGRKIPEFLKTYLKHHPNSTYEITELETNLKYGQIKEINGDLGFLLGVLSSAFTIACNIFDLAHSVFTETTADHCKLSFYPSELLLEAFQLEFGERIAKGEPTYQESHHSAVAKMLTQRLRPLLISALKHFVHGCWLHPFLVLLHDLYHLLAWTQVDPQLRDELSAVYECSAKVFPPELMDQLDAPHGYFVSFLLELEHKGSPEQVFETRFKNHLNLVHPHYLKELHRELKTRFEPGHVCLRVFESSYKHHLAIEDSNPESSNSPLERFGNNEDGFEGSEKSLLIIGGLGLVVGVGTIAVKVSLFAAAVTVGGVAVAALAIGAVAVLYGKGKSAGAEGVIACMRMGINLAVERVVEQAWSRLISPEVSADFYRESLNDLEAEDCVLKDEGNYTPKTDYRNVLLEAQQGKLTPFQMFRRLEEILREDFMRACAATGEISRSPTLIDGMLAEKLCFKRGLGNAVEKDPFITDSLSYLAHIIWRILRLYIGSNLEGDSEAVIPSLSFFLQKIYELTGLRNVSLRVTRSLAKVGQIKEMSSRDTRPALVSCRKQIIHGSEELHPYVALLHDVPYHAIVAALAKMLAPQAKKDFFAIFECLENSPKELIELCLKKDELISALLEQIYINPGKLQPGFKMVFSAISALKPSQESLTAFYGELRSRFTEDHPVLAAFQAVFKIETSQSSITLSETKNGFTNLQMLGAVAVVSGIVVYATVGITMSVSVGMLIPGAIAILGIGAMIMGGPVKKPKEKELLSSTQLISNFRQQIEDEKNEVKIEFIDSSRAQWSEEEKKQIKVILNSIPFLLKKNINGKSIRFLKGDDTHFERKDNAYAAYEPFYGSFDDAIIFYKGFFNQSDRQKKCTVAHELTHRYVAHRPEVEAEFARLSDWRGFSLFKDLRDIFFPAPGQFSLRYLGSYLFKFFLGPYEMIFNDSSIRNSSFRAGARLFVGSFKSVECEMVPQYAGSDHALTDEREDFADAVGEAIGYGSLGVDAQRTFRYHLLEEPAKKSLRADQIDRFQKKWDLIRGCVLGLSDALIHALADEMVQTSGVDPEKAKSNLQTFVRRAQEVTTATQLEELRREHASSLATLVRPLEGERDRSDIIDFAAAREARKAREEARRRKAEPSPIEAIIDALPPSRAVDIGKPEEVFGVVQHPQTMATAAREFSETLGRVMERELKEVEEGKSVELYVAPAGTVRSRSDFNNERDLKEAIREEYLSKVTFIVEVIDSPGEKALIWVHSIEFDPETDCLDEDFVEIIAGYAGKALSSSESLQKAPPALRAIEGEGRRVVGLPILSESKEETSQAFYSTENLPQIYRNSVEAALQTDEENPHGISTGTIARRVYGSLQRELSNLSVRAAVARKEVIPLFLTMTGDTNTSSERTDHLYKIEVGLAFVAETDSGDPIYRVESCKRSLEGEVQEGEPGYEYARPTQIVVEALLDPALQQIEKAKFITPAQNSSPRRLQTPLVAGLAVLSLTVGPLVAIGAVAAVAVVGLSIAACQRGKKEGIEGNLERFRKGISILVGSENIVPLVSTSPLTTRVAPLSAHRHRAATSHSRNFSRKPLSVAKAVSVLSSGIAILAASTPLLAEAAVKASQQGGGVLAGAFATFFPAFIPVVYAGLTYYYTPYKGNGAKEKQSISDFLQREFPIAEKDARVLWKKQMGNETALREACYRLDQDGASSQTEQEILQERDEVLQVIKEMHEIERRAIPLLRDEWEEGSNERHWQTWIEIQADLEDKSLELREKIEALREKCRSYRKKSPKVVLQASKESQDAALSSTDPKAQFQVDNDHMLEAMMNSMASQAIGINAARPTLQQIGTYKARLLVGSPTAGKVLAIINEMRTAKAELDRLLASSWAASDIPKKQEECGKVYRKILSLRKSLKAFREHLGKTSREVEEELKRVAG